jgi:hypothetical protein
LARFASPIRARGAVRRETAQPGREPIGFPLTLARTSDTLGTPVKFGSATSPAERPFGCPSGLFAQSTNAIHLSMNDEGYGDSPQTPTCGGAGDTTRRRYPAGKDQSVEKDHCELLTIIVSAISEPT